VVLAAVTLVLADQLHLRGWRAEVRDSNPVVRTQTLYTVGSERESRLVEDVHTVLMNEQDREALGAAGYATMRMGDPRGVELLCRRADEAPDDHVRAKLIMFAARLSNRNAQLEEWLVRGTQTSQPWQRAGSAAGLLLIGDLEGGRILLDVARGPDPLIRGFAIEKLRWIEGPMAETIGRPIRDWPAPQTCPDARWESLLTFWEEHATEGLLKDLLTRLSRSDSTWFELDRLIHARHRAAGWLK